MSKSDLSKAVLILDRLENDKAVLVAGKEEVILPKKYLPRSAAAGEAFCLTLETESGERKRREKAAKELINEILRGR